MKYAAIFCALLFTTGVIIQEKQQEKAEPSAPVQVHQEPTTETTTTVTTTTTIPLEEQEPFYALTTEERELVEQVVMAEAGGEPEKGQRAVAQCILNASLLDEIRPAEVITKYSYAKSRPKPSEQVKASVAAVFDDGDLVTDEPILFFYAPARCSSAFHESQTHVITIGGHKFFKEEKQ